MNGERKESGGYGETPDKLLSCAERQLPLLWHILASGSCWRFAYLWDNRLCAACSLPLCMAAGSSHIIVGIDIDPEKSETPLTVPFIILLEL